MSISNALYLQLNGMDGWTVLSFDVCYVWQGFKEDRYLGMNGTWDIANDPRPSA